MQTCRPFLLTSALQVLRKSDPPAAFGVPPASVPQCPARPVPDHRQTAWIGACPTADTEHENAPETAQAVLHRLRVHIRKSCFLPHWSYWNAPVPFRFGRQPVPAIPNTKERVSADSSIHQIFFFVTCIRLLLLNKSHK